MFSRVSYTLNFDGSHNNQANKAGAGCIIRDGEGELVVAAAYNLSKTDIPYYSYNVAIAEAVGLRNGLRLASKHNLILTSIKGDNKEVIDLVLGRARRSPGPPLTDIIAEIKNMFKPGSAELKLMVIDRDANKVADKLASMGSLLLTESKVFTRYDIYDLPPQVADLIKQEKVSSRSKQEEEGISLENVAAGAAAVVGLIGLGMSAWSFFSGETSASSSDQHSKIESKAIEAPKTRDTRTNNIPDWFTLQYFGSDRNQVQKARAGCIIKNKGQFVVAAAYNLDSKYPGCNVAIAEAIALKNGLELALTKYVNLDCIQGRNVEIRDRVLGREKKPPRFEELNSIIQEIRYVFDEHHGIDPNKLRLVEEETIQVARELATVGGTLEKEAMVYPTVQDLPPRVARLVN